MTHEELDLMKEGFKGVHSRLDKLNNRTRKVEISTAIQWTFWGLAGTFTFILAMTGHLAVIWR